MNTQEQEDTVVEIHIELIDDHPENPRGEVTEIPELASSIVAVGLLSPLVVRELGDRYQLVCGHRRKAALQLLKKGKAPCIVRDLTDEEALAIMLVENCQRVDLGPMDEAEAYGRLRDLLPSLDAVASEVGRAVSYVRNRLKLMGLPPSLKELVRTKRLQLGGAMVLASLKAEQLQEFLDQHDIEADDEEAGASWDEGDVLTASEVRRWVQLRARRLATAAFCTKACMACPRRTGAQQTLFGEAVADDDRCLESSCWEQKLRGVIEERRRKAIDDGKVVVDDAVARWGAAPGWVLGTRRVWEVVGVCDINEPNVMDLVAPEHVVYGFDEEGRLLPVVAERHFQEVLERLAPRRTKSGQKAEEAERKLKEKVRVRRLPVVARACCRGVTASNEAVEVLRLLVEDKIARGGSNAVVRYCKRHGLKFVDPKSAFTAIRSEAASADAEGLLSMLLSLAMTYADVEGAEELARKRGVDLDAIEAEVREEAQKREQQKANKRKPKRKTRARAEKAEVQQ